MHIFERAIEIYKIQMYFFTGTRFRPLSFDIPKPLFPVAGVPTIQHLIEACCKVPNLREILLIGFYQADEALRQFATSMIKEYNINIRYVLYN